jgi:hypothetical protein
MKRTLLPVTAVLVALMLFFAGCQDPLSDYTVTNKDELPEIAGPEWVKAEALPGANHITWAFTKDAKGYVVYRQKVNENGEALSAFEVHEVETTTGEYFDAVKLNNQLEHDALYRYGVIAYTNASLAARSLDYVKDGVTYAEPVKANIPAQGTAVAKLGTPEFTDANISTKAVKNTNGNDELLVSWPSLHPMFSYNVKYALGNATLAVDISNSYSLTYGAVNYYHTPLFGGDTQITLGITFGGDQYYYTPDTFTKAVKETLTQPLNLSLYTYEVSRNSGSEATITWNGVVNGSSLNVGDYKLYRIEAKNIGTGPVSSNSSQIEVVGDWTPVTIGISSATNGGISVTDTGLDPVKAYLYALYAEVDGRKSAPKLHGLAAQTVNIDALNFDVETSFTTATDNTRAYSVTIGWNKVEGASVYTLEKAITTKYPTETIGAYTAVGTAAPAQVGGRYTVTDTPAIRQSYKYRLTVTVNGVEVVGFRDLNSDPFREYVEGSSFSVNPSSDTAYATDISFTPSEYVKDLKADIYRAEVPKSSSQNIGFSQKAIEQAAFKPVIANHPLALDQYGNIATYTDTGLAIGTQYIYRVEYKYKVIVDGKEEERVLRDASPYAGYTGYVQNPSVPQFYSSNVNLSYKGTQNYYTVSFVNYSEKLLINAQIVSQTRSYNATTGQYSEWTAGGGITGTLALHSADETSNVKLGTGAGAIDTGVSPGSYYFFVTPPTNPGTTQYRLVLVDDKNADNYSYLTNLVP